MAEPEKKCPRCHEKVKLLASLCKHCSYEFSSAEMDAARKQQASASNFGIGCAVVLGMLVLLGFCRRSEDPPVTNTPSASSDAGSTASASSSSYADVGKQAAWVSTGKEAIRNQLKDPESATFRNVHFYSGGGIPVVCGEVNARNGFGGYTGFDRFVSAGTVISVVESQVDGGLDQVWNKYCIRAASDSI